MYTKSHLLYDYRISLSTVQLQSIFEYHLNLITKRDKLIKIKTNLENGSLELKSQWEQTDGELPLLKNPNKISKNSFIDNGISAEVSQCK